MTPTVAARDMHKRFQGVAALAGASIEVPRGSVVALVGENGAGKSTLIKIISGAQRRDSGELLIDGEPVDFHSPLDASNHGVATVYQELSLLPDLSVAENLVLGTYPRRHGLINWRKARRDAAAFFEELGLRLRVDRPVAQLSLAERYLVEIAKAVRHRPRILILDEPTAALDPQDAEQIFLLVEELTRAGTAVIFVSHRLSEIFRCAQHYMVLKDGVTVASGTIADTSEDDLVAKMLGSEPRSTAAPRRARGTGEAIFKVSGLASASVGGVSFEARRGEIVGIAGLRGSGQTQLCRALAGADRITAGRMEVRGRAVTPRSPHHAWQLGIGLLPVDRKSQGLFMNMSVAENVAMSRMVKGQLGWVSKRRQHAIAAEFKTKLDMRLPRDRLGAPVADLSGGNQQKVVLGRCLAADLAVLVLDEPTRGVDVGAKQQIHELIARAAHDGLCVIVSSSELSELLDLATTLVVLHRGEMTACLEGADVDERAILRHASGTVLDQTDTSEGVSSLVRGNVDGG
jgi:ribose transport system ATP-binding protein/rhamnose transport system ATP-binding protein